VRPPGVSLWIDAFTGQDFCGFHSVSRALSSEKGWRILMLILHNRPTAELGISRMFFPASVIRASIQPPGGLRVRLAHIFNGMEK